MVNRTECPSLAEAVMGGSDETIIRAATLKLQIKLNCYLAQFLSSELWSASPSTHPTTPGREATMILVNS